MGTEKSFYASNNNRKEYQIRVDCKAVKYYDSLDSDVFEDFVAVCAVNPNKYVDIMKVSYEIIMNQHSHSQLRKHFKSSDNKD